MNMSDLCLPAAEPKCYLVRTIRELVEQGIVGVGWVDHPFPELTDAEAAIHKIDADYGIGRYANQVRRFFAISEGDLVVVPLPYSVAIGRATGGMFFDERYYQQDRANQRSVVFPRDAEGRVATIPRAAFSEAFQRRLRVMGMVVNDLTEFRSDIQTALESIENGKDFSWPNRLIEEKLKKEAEFRLKLIGNIQSGRTNLLTGGTGLEDLVCELVQLEGYEARVLSKRHFGSFADADVEASRSDRWSAVKVLFQVKHHQGVSGDHGLNQLLEIRNAHVGEYDEHVRVLVTSASASEELRKRATNEGVIIIDGQALASWIGEHLDELKPETKDRLGIYEVPAVF